MINNLKKLEKNLGFRLQDYACCLAIDIATKSGIAVVIINKGKVSINAFTIKIPALPKDVEDKNEKYEQHLKLFSKLLDDELINKCVHLQGILDKERLLLCIENSFLKMNVVTFGFLRAIQGIAYEKLHSKFGKTMFIFPISARKMVGFQSSLSKGSKPKDKKKEIMKFISNVVEETITDDNIADALLLAFAGLKK